MPKIVQPGLIPTAIALKADEPNKEYVLSVDGKKVGIGLNSENGDINLWGHEVPNFSEQKERLETDCEHGEKGIDILSSYILKPDMGLKEVTEGPLLTSNLKDLAKKVTL